MVEAGIAEYEILAMGDDRMCDICGEMHGRTFSVSETQKVIDSVLDIKSPDKFKEAMPWHTSPPVGVNSEKLISDGMSIPPFHGRCRCVLIMASEDEAKNVFTAPSIKNGLELAEGLFLDTGEGLRDVFLDSPQFIKDLYSKHKDSLFGILLDLEPGQAFYDSASKVLHFHDMKNASFVSHEFGHHVDFSMGNVSSHSIFADAVKKAMDSLKGASKYSVELRENMRNIMLDEKAYYDDSFSDIFCALVRANHKYYDLWGNADHKPEQYEQNLTIRAEIFANLFSIYSQNDSLAITHLQNTFPGIIKAFLEVTDGVGKKDEK